MANFVLVHGAWHGAWCWRDVAARLRGAGHTVLTPTHTGVGERAHQSGEAVTLLTHVRDVAGYVEMEELDEVVLVGHSYGGMVITQLADLMPERVRALVYLDGFVPAHGQSLIDLLHEALAPEVAAEFVGGFRGSAREDGSGMMRPIPAEVFGIAEANRAWVDRRCVPQALATFESPALLTGAGDAVGARVYLLADGWDPSPFRHFAARYENASGWRVARLPCGHDVMVDMPEELAAELLTLV